VRLSGQLHIPGLQTDVHLPSSRSCAKLSYEDAQNVIEGKSLGDVAVDAEQKAEDVEEDIRNLNVSALRPTTS
jgi:hypothetical protein